MIDWVRGSHVTLHADEDGYWWNRPCCILRIDALCGLREACSARLHLAHEPTGCGGFCSAASEVDLMC